MDEITISPRATSLWKIFKLMMNCRKTHRFATFTVKIRNHKFVTVEITSTEKITLESE